MIHYGNYICLFRQKRRRIIGLPQFAATLCLWSPKAYE